MEDSLAEEFEKRRRGDRRKWKSIKILRETDELLEKYSKTLGMTKYEFVDFVIRLFAMLLRDRIKINREKARVLGLTECEAEHDMENSYLYPACVVYNIVSYYFRRRYAYQTLLENLKQMYEKEKEEEAEKSEEGWEDEG